MILSIAGHVSRAMFSRYSHVRIEAKHRTLDEIAARQCEADEKRQKEAAEGRRYRGQEIDSEQLAFLREFIRTHPASSRWKLSRQLCEALGWKQANGALRDMVCRGLLLHA